MATTREDIDQLLKTASEEWNRAEEVVKSAEQICGEPVIPSIKELRYAGRRLVDSLNADTARDLDLVQGLLKDAIFNCHCARHDAIDVATAIIASNLSIVVREIGYEHVLSAYPDFAKLRKELSHIRAKIRVSRANRSQREEIYRSIHDVDLPAIAGLYDDFHSAEDIMRSLARKSRMGELIKNLLTGASVLIAAGSLVFAVIKKSPPTYIYLSNRVNGASAPPVPTLYTHLQRLPVTAGQMPSR